VKYINQINLVLALAGVLIVFYTVSSTVLQDTDFEPVTVQPVEVERPVRQPAQSGFTRNPSASPSTFSQMLSERQNTPSSSEGPEGLDPGNSEMPSSPFPGIENSANKRFVPQNRPSPVQRTVIPGRQLLQDREEPTDSPRPRPRPPATRRGSSLIGASEARTPARSVDAGEKRGTSDQPAVPPVRGSMQQSPPPPQ
jgi:hypothetical protein